MKNPHNELKQRLPLTNQKVDKLNSPAVLIYLLRNSDLDNLEPCEIETALKGIEDLLYKTIDSLNDEVAYLYKLVEGKDE